MCASITPPVMVCQQSIVTNFNSKNIFVQIAETIAECFKKIFQIIAECFQSKPSKKVMDLAATNIQKIVRGKLVRKKLLQKVMDLAATNIQKIVRGKLVRKKLLQKEINIQEKAKAEAEKLVSKVTAIALLVIGIGIEISPKEVVNSAEEISRQFEWIKSEKVEYVIALINPELFEYDTFVGELIEYLKVEGIDFQLERILSILEDKSQELPEIVGFLSFIKTAKKISQELIRNAPSLILQLIKEFIEGLLEYVPVLEKKVPDKKQSLGDIKKILETLLKVFNMPEIQQKFESKLSHSLNESKKISC